MKGLAVSRCRSREQREVHLAGRRRARDGAALAEDALRRGDGVGGRPVGRRGAGLLDQPGQAVLHGLEVGQDQLGVHRLDVGRRVDPGVDVDDVVVVEGPHHLADGVGLADGGQELVAQPLPLATRRAPGPAMSTNVTVAGTTGAPS